jgi:hypothetical protein
MVFAGNHKKNGVRGALLRVDGSRTSCVVVLLHCYRRCTPRQHKLYGIADWSSCHSKETMAGALLTVNGIFITVFGHKGLVSI